MQNDDAPSPIDPAAGLLARWQDHGDREALGELLLLETQALKAQLRRTAARNAGADASVSDIAQEVALRVMRAIPPPVFDSPRALHAYLWTAASRLVAERLRSRRAARSIDDGASEALAGELATSGGFSDVERRDRAVALHVLVQLLEPEEQEILELVGARELTYEAAGEQLGLTREQVKLRYTKARDRLAHKLLRWTEALR